MAGSRREINIGPPETSCRSRSSASRRTPARGSRATATTSRTAPKPGQALTLIAAEALEAMAAEHGIEITAADVAPQRPDARDRPERARRQALPRRRRRVRRRRAVRALHDLEGVTQPGVIKGLRAPRRPERRHPHRRRDRRRRRGRRGGLRWTSRSSVACAQVEPVVFDRDGDARQARARRRRGRRAQARSSCSSPRRSSPRTRRQPLGARARGRRDGKQVFARLARAVGRGAERRHRRARRDRARARHRRSRSA